MIESTKSKALPHQQKEETFVIFADIKNCLKRHFIKILLFIILFLSLGFWLSLTRPVKYMIEATYKDSGGSGGGGGMMQSLLRYVGVPGSHRSCTVLKSYFLVIEVIKELGLQATVNEETKWDAYKRNIKENWRAEKRKLISQIDRFTFSHVHYEGKKTKGYQLIFSSPAEFEIRHPKRGLLTLGRLGEKVAFDQISLTILQAPETLKLHHAYPLSILPSASIYMDLKNHLDIEANLKDGSIYEFSFSHRDPEFAKNVIDCLMKQYQQYLNRESDRIALEQIAYLERRKDEFCSKMDEYLGDHVAYLKDSLGSKGFLNLNQLLQIMARKKQTFLDQQIAINSEESRLDDWLLGGQEILMEGEMASLQKEIHSLKKQRDTMDLAFLLRKKKKKVKCLMPPYSLQEEAFQNCLDKLDKITWDEDVIEVAEKGESAALLSLFPELFSAVHEHTQIRLKQRLSAEAFGRILSSSAGELKQVRQQRAELEKWLQTAVKDKQVPSHPIYLIHMMEDMPKEDVISYVRHHLRLISLQENLLKERLFYPRIKQQAFQGIDLGTARVLYRDYIHQRDGYEAKIRQLTFSKDHLADPDFEYISLTQVLPDGVSQDLCQKMGGIVQAMRDTRNLSERDLERMKRNFNKLQQDLIRHINQTIELYYLQIDLTKERIASVQSVVLDLLNQEISLLDQQIEDRIIQRKKALQVERKLIEKRLQDIEAELATIPDQWLKEYQLQFSSEMNMNMLEGMVQMVESKNIEHNLIQIQSKPLDQAHAGLYPNSPHIQTFTIIGGVIGLIVGCVFAIGYDFSRGFPLTLENLRMQGRITCGRLKRRFLNRSLNEINDSNLQVLRELSSKLPDQEEGIVAALLTGGKGQYSTAFAKLLTIEGKKVLYLDLNAKSKSSSGLFSYLQGESKQPEVQHKQSYDKIDLGEKNRFSMDLLKHPRFHTFLEEMRQQYNVILLQSSHSLDSAEGRFFMTLADYMTLTLQAESIDQVRPYFAWEDSGNVLTFVTC